MRAQWRKGDASSEANHRQSASNRGARGGPRALGSIALLVTLTACHRDAMNGQVPASVAAPGPRPHAMFAMPSDCPTLPPPSPPFNAYAGRAQPMGYFSAGARAALLGGHAQSSLVLANGLDESPQPLAVYALPAVQRPQWYSDDIGYLGRIAMGDVDQDGFNDAVVAVLFDESLNFGGGGARLYAGNADSFDRRPRQTISGAATLAVALGDADGDGDLDLVVAVMSKSGTYGSWPPPPSGPVRIYANVHGRFDDQPIWQSEEEEYVGALALSDVDGDGHLDLIAAGARLRVYRSHASPDGRHLPARRASWQSQESWQLGYSLAIAALGSPARRAVVVSPTCVGGPCTLEPPVAYYMDKMSARESPADWTASSAGIGGGILMADFDGDGLVDLLAGRIIEASTDPTEPLRYYKGNAGGLETQPSFCTASTFVASDLAALPPNGGPPLAGSSETFPSGEAKAVTVRHPIFVLDEVRVGDTKLDPKSFSYALGSDAVALGPTSSRVPRGARDANVTVKYRFVVEPDVAIAEWRPNEGAGTLPNAASASQGAASSRSAKGRAPFTFFHPSPSDDSH
jgi:hypothetical protein